MLWHGTVISQREGTLDDNTSRQNSVFQVGLENVPLKKSVVRIASPKVVIYSGPRHLSVVYLPRILQEDCFPQKRVCFLNFIVVSALAWPDTGDVFRLFMSLETHTGKKQKTKNKQKKRLRPGFASVIGAKESLPLSQNPIEVISIHPK